MATTAQIVSRAYKRLNIIRPQADPTAAQAQYGLDAFNEMVDSWAGDGVDVTADLPLAAKHERGLVALLAVRLAPDYGKEPSPLLLIEAKDGWTRLQAEYITPPDPVDFDPGIKVLPSTGISGVDIINNE